MTPFYRVYLDPSTCTLFCSSAPLSQPVTEDQTKTIPVQEASLTATLITYLPASCPLVSDMSRLFVFCARKQPGSSSPARPGPASRAHAQPLTQSPTLCSHRMHACMHTASFHGTKDTHFHHQVSVRVHPADPDALQHAAEPVIRNR